MSQQPTLVHAYGRCRMWLGAVLGEGFEVLQVAALRVVNAVGFKAPSLMARSRVDKRGIMVVLGALKPLGVFAPNLVGVVVGC
jgi:hypothetical protein